MHKHILYTRYLCHVIILMDTHTIKPPNKLAISSKPFFLKVSNSVSIMKTQNTMPQSWIVQIVTANTRSYFTCCAISPKCRHIPDIQYTLHCHNNKRNNNNNKNNVLDFFFRCFGAFLYILNSNIWCEVKKSIKNSHKK